MAKKRQRKEGKGEGREGGKKEGRKGGRSGGRGEEGRNPVVASEKELKSISQASWHTHHCVDANECRTFASFHYHTLKSVPSSNSSDLLANPII
jgi:hypothetical protein